MPLYDVGLRRRRSMAAAIGFYELLAVGRNRAVSPALSVGAGGILSKAEVMERCPCVPETGLKGGALWQEGKVLNPPRLLMEALRWAEACGGVSRNYVAASSILGREGRVAGLALRDTTTGEEAEVRAPRIVLCLGAGREEAPIGGVPSERSETPLFLSYNLVVSRPLGSSVALAVAPDGGRGHLFFLVPFGTNTLAGTTHDPWKPGLDRKPGGREVSRMVATLQEAIPDWSLAESDVLQTLSGLVPEKARGDRIEDLSSKGGLRGLFRVRSAKYTTAPLTAHRALSAVLGGRTPDPAHRPRPKARAVFTCEEFLEMHTSDESRARTWVTTLAASEGVRYVEDFVLRRADWGMQPDEAAEACRVVSAYIPELPRAKNASG